MCHLPSRSSEDVTDDAYQTPAPLSDLICCPAAMMAPILCNGSELATDFQNVGRLPGITLAIDDPRVSCTYSVHARKWSFAKAGACAADADGFPRWNLPCKIPHMTGEAPQTLSKNRRQHHSDSMPITYMWCMRNGCSVISQRSLREGATRTLARTELRHSMHPCCQRHLQDCPYVPKCVLDFQSKIPWR